MVKKIFVSQIFNRRRTHGNILIILNILPLREIFHALQKNDPFFEAENIFFQNQTN